MTNIPNNESDTDKQEAGGVNLFLTKREADLIDTAMMFMARMLPDTEADKVEYADLHKVIESQIGGQS